MDSGDIESNGMQPCEVVVRIDERACIGCGMCVEDCFPGVMCLNGRGVAECAAPCLECGHCVAVCPTNAVSIDGYDMSDVEDCDAPSLLGADGVLRMIKGRRSIRRFQARPLSSDALHSMLEAGRYSPTARNLQGTRFVVVQRDMQEFRGLVWSEMPAIVDLLRQTAPDYAERFAAFLRIRNEEGRDLLLFDAPAFIAIATPNDWDAGLAAANMEMTAVSAGAGVLHSGYMKRIVSASPLLAEWLDAGAPVSCCMLVGYPSVSYRRTAPRKAGHCTIR